MQKKVKLKVVIRLRVLLNKNRVTILYSTFEYRTKDAENVSTVGFQSCGLLLIPVEITNNTPC